MSKFYQKPLLISGLVLSMVLCGTSTFASANEPEAINSSQTVPLVQTGFDEEIASANGYKIVTDENGVTSSIPVTPEAIAFEAALARRVSMLRTTVYGPCGSSWINVSSYGSRVVFTTGYSVTRPVIAKMWIVQVYGAAGLPSALWNGASGATWSSSYSIFYNSGGFANVSPGSNVVMNNGAVCLSGSPGVNF